MDMFSFLNNGVLFCMMNAKKNMEIEENEYMDWLTADIYSHRNYRTQINIG